MAFNTDFKYPTRRVYVVKVRGDAKPDALAGRLEKLVTGRQIIDQRCPAFCACNKLIPQRPIEARRSEHD